MINKKELKEELDNFMINEQLPIPYDENIVKIVHHIVEWAEKKIEAENVVIAPILYQETIEKYYKDGMNKQLERCMAEVERRMNSTNRLNMFGCYDTLADLLAYFKSLKQ